MTGSQQVVGQRPPDDLAPCGGDLAVQRPGGYTDACLVDLVLRADGDALANLRSKALAPLDDLRPTVEERLIEILRAWLLHPGRRDSVAAALFVHPQTVRYRIGQLHELHGDKLQDPTAVLELTLVLGAAETRVSA